MNRRNFIWFLSLSTTGIVVKLFSSYYYEYASIFQKKLKKIRLPNQNKLTVHTAFTAREIRKRFRIRPIWNDTRLIVNLQEKNKLKIIHWPHPGLPHLELKLFEWPNFKLRYEVNKNNQETHSPSEWPSLLADKTKRLEKKKSSSIIEIFALNEIDVSKVDSKKNPYQFNQLGKSIEVLENRGLKKKLNKGEENDKRLLTLFYRLVALDNENNSINAYEKIKEYQLTPHSQLPQSRSESVFKKWHAKTIDQKYNKFRKKLYHRIMIAKKLMGQSSSGKDTA